MSRKCPQCKAKIKTNGSYCTQCGAFMGISKKTGKKNKKSKPKKDPKKILKKLAVVLAVVAVIAFVWFAVGNMITLTIQSDNDMEILNSGSLEVPGAKYSRYSELPDYVVEMLGEDPDADDYGPLMSEIIPHIRVERNKVNGWFGESSIEYTIYAPDMESWLLNLDTAENYTSDSLFKEMQKHIPDAPMRSQVVTVTYARDGFFGWQGNYMDLDFTNAISGGINTAYNEIYSQITEEMEEQLK